MIVEDLKKFLSPIVNIPVEEMVLFEEETPDMFNFLGDAKRELQAYR